MFDALGWVFGPIFVLLSCLLVALIIILGRQLRIVRAIPPVFLEDFTDMVHRRRFKDAFDLCDNSFLSCVLHDGMSRLPFGLEDAREVMCRSVESRMSRMDQLLAYLATIGTGGAMLGLVATVYAIIFVIVGPGGLAAGVNHALAVTLTGIAISIPAIFAHAFFKNRLIHIAMEVATISDQLITQMYKNGPPEGGPASSSIVPRTSPPSGFTGTGGAIPEIE